MIILRLLISAAAVALACSSCAYLPLEDLETYYKLRDQGKERIERKSPARAGLLNLLPGVGNFYLGAGTDPKTNGGQFGIGILNVFMWPFSVVWGIPQAVIDAEKLNKIETIRYWNVKREREQRLRGQEEKYKAKMAEKTPPAKEPPIPKKTPAAELP